MEKSALPLAVEPPPQPRRPCSRRRIACAAALAPLALAAYLLAPSSLWTAASSALPLAGGRAHTADAATEPRCVQPAPLFPRPDDALDRAYAHLSTDAFRNASIRRLSGAVQVRSESFDDLGPIGEDPRWDVMYDLYDYLRKTFPLVHDRLAVEKVNTHGLLYTWRGSDPSLRPTLLMAHQDTVPVPPETIPSWTYPPWSGHYDGTYVWGRGASDCKNQLVAALEAVEALLSAGFAPRRTLLLSFGFDEECSGRQGASHLARVVEARYGKGGVAVIVDEGAGFEQTWGTLFAKPATGEKGYTDVYVTVRTPGGHSSIPPDHTAIGILGEIITQIEADQYPTRLSEQNPYFGQLLCGAQHSPAFPPQLRKLLDQRLHSPSSFSASSSSSSSSPAAHICQAAKPDRLALEAAKQGPGIKYLMQTSQAVDVIAGGIKVNALPERVTATVNHRINIGEGPELVWARLASVAGAVARRHNLTLHAFDTPLGSDEPESAVTLRASAATLRAAPVSPSDAGADPAGPFAVLAGTTRALYGADVVVAPGIMTGNTDTRYYWDVTRHIFRFGPGFDPEDDGSGGELRGVHTVDERVSVAAHVNTVKWFTLFVRNMDEADI